MERRHKKLYYKIGEACRALDIQPYVLRYWETEFAVLAPSKSKSGQRVYTENELDVSRRIKELLYERRACAPATAGDAEAGCRKPRPAARRRGAAKAPRAAPPHRERARRGAPDPRPAGAKRTELIRLFEFGSYLVGTPGFEPGTP